MNKLKATLAALIVSGAGASLIASVMIKDLEGVRFTPYYDIGGVLTVCYGHTGNDIVSGKTYSQDECNEIYDSDIIPFTLAIENLVTVKLSEPRKAALISFTYNVGIQRFKDSTLLRKLNSSDDVGACNELKRWVYVKGKIWQGMINRRDVELFVCDYRFDNDE